MRELPPGLLALPAMHEAHIHAPKAEWDEWDAAIRELSLRWQVSETTASEAMARLERIGVNFADPQDAAADATDGMSRAERALAVKRQPPAWAGLTDRKLGRRR